MSKAIKFLAACVLAACVLHVIFANGVKPFTQSLAKVTQAVR